MAWRVLLALVLLTGAAPATAAEIRDVTVEHEGKRYTMRSETWFDAPRAGVFDILTDYAQFDRISSVYDETRFEPPAEDAELVRGVLEEAAREVEFHRH